MGEHHEVLHATLYPTRPIALLLSFYFRVLFVLRVAPLEEHFAIKLLIIQINLGHQNAHT